MTNTDPRPRPQDLASVQTISRTDQKSALNHEWEPATLTELATLMELAPGGTQCGCSPSASGSDGLCVHRDVVAKTSTADL